MGNVTGRVMIPMMAAGDYTIFFVGRQSQNPVSVGFNIQGFHPWVLLDNYAPSPHQRLGFEGQDFAPSEEVLVYLDQQGGQSVAQLKADAYGRLLAPNAWVVGELIGKHDLIFVGQESGAIVNMSIAMQP
jgi:hypothetical protein